MMAGFSARIRHAWNAFIGQNNGDNLDYQYEGASAFYGSSPSRTRLSFSNERSILVSILNRISLDVTSLDFRHVRLDENDRYLEDIGSGLNYCLTIEANIDQGAKALLLDTVMTCLDKGVVAVVPVDTTVNPNETGSFDIQTMRVAEIVNWYPQHVRVRVYNEKTGKKQEIVLPKKFVGIVENPLYSIMNEPNSTLQRLIRKLNMLDVVDEQVSSGKLDLIIQLPYVVKSEARRQQAEQRRQDIEFQLKGSQYGIAYTDGTEKITQLNRPAENNLLKQIEYLTALLYTQLGLTEDIMNGTASETAMLNYFHRTVEPIANAILEEMRRKFLTKTARSQRQTLLYFRDPFRLVPLTGIADIADKLSRNEIVSSNEMRQVLGMKPSKDPNADKLQNSNMPQQTPQLSPNESQQI